MLCSAVPFSLLCLHRLKVWIKYKEKMISGINKGRHRNRSQWKQAPCRKVKEKQALPKLKTERDCQKCHSKSTTEVGIQITPCNIQTKALLHTVFLRQHKQLLQAQRTTEFSSSVLTQSDRLTLSSASTSIPKILSPCLLLQPFFTRAQQRFCFSW